MIKEYTADDKEEVYWTVAAASLNNVAAAAVTRLGGLPDESISMFVEAMHMVDMMPMMMKGNQANAGCSVLDSAINISTSTTTNPNLPQIAASIRKAGRSVNSGQLSNNGHWRQSRSCCRIDQGGPIMLPSSTPKQPYHHPQEQLFLSFSRIGPACDVSTDHLSPLQIFVRPIVINTTTLLALMTACQSESQPRHIVAAAIMYNAGLYSHLKGSFYSTEMRDRALQMSDFYYCASLSHIEAAVQSNVCQAIDALLLRLATWNNRAHLQCALFCSVATRAQCLDSMRLLLTSTVNYYSDSPLATSSSVSSLLLPDESCIFRSNVYFLQQLDRAGLAPAA